MGPPAHHSQISPRCADEGAIDATLVALSEIGLTLVDARALKRSAAEYLRTRWLGVCSWSLLDPGCVKSRRML